MLLSEPPRSQGDVNFALFGFPVRIHPFFWLATFILGFGRAAGGNMRQAVVDLAVWTAAVFLSILIHELGHAAVMRRFGFSPRITLHGFGGLASYDTGGRYGGRLPDTLGQISISAAGPGAGFLLAGLVIGLMFMSGHKVSFHFGGSFGVGIYVSMIGSKILTDFIFCVIYISLVWGLVNLLPIYPLDGGQISREIMLRLSTGAGIRNSLLLSMWTSGAVSIFGLLQWLKADAESISFPFVAIFFAYLAYGNYVTLHGYTDGRSW